MRKRIEPTRRTRSEPAAQGNKGQGKVGRCEVVKPRDRSARLIDPGIEFDGSKSRERSMKARDIIEREPKNAEPIDQPVVREDAQRQHLVKTGTEPPIAERAVEVVRNMTEPVARIERSRSS
jgi:hypothetical protein